MKKIHKSGYAYLKEKVAKLEKRNADLAEQLHAARDSWDVEHAKRVNAENDLLREMERSERMAKAAAHTNEFVCERYVWLYEHAPFWLKWWFKHTFKGATK